MPRPKKDGAYLNLYMDRTLLEGLEKYAKEQGQTKTMALERIVQQFLQKQTSEK